MGMKPIAKVCALALGCAALLATPAVAGQAGGSAEGGVERKSAGKDPGRKVCRNLVLSGSRLSTRSCRTQAEWDKAAHDAQDSALQQQTGAGFRPEQAQPGASTPR